MLAFDFGLRRIGVAIGETLLGSARPLATIDAAANAQRFAAIDRLIGEWRPARLVVGLPAHADREGPHEFAARCERFARQLAGRYRLPVEFADERFSSVEAEAQHRGDERKASIDATAAAIILQTWFEQRLTHPATALPDAPAAAIDPVVSS
ncbi:MAG: Holliday junction resolvase RuvX [Rhodocyclaceae bacterium]